MHSGAPFRFSGGGSSAQLSTRALMCWGVVPQQPPKRAVWGANSNMVAANSSGPTSNCVTPSCVTGRPAFGLTTRGRSVAARARGTRRLISLGPSPQLKPTAEAPREEATIIAVSTSAPLKSFPSSSNVKVTTKGRLECSFTARIAALAS